MKKNIYCLLIIFISTFYINIIYTQKIVLKNHSQDALYIYLTRKIGKNIEKILRPLEKFEYSFARYIINIAVVPISKNIYSVESLKKILPNPYTESIKANLILGLENKTSYLSFDFDNKKKPKFYVGIAGCPKDFSFLVISDIHSVGKDINEINQMKEKELNLYGANNKNEDGSIQSIQETKDKLIQAHNKKTSLINKMINYIKDPSKNIQAVIMPGDLAGGYGKKSEVEAFKTKCYNRLKNSFSLYGGNVWLGIGNHDCYWNSFFEPYPTSMLRFIKSIHKNYLYSFYIGNVLFIHLGLHPSQGKGNLKEVSNSIDFLKTRLIGIKKQTPVVIFFHYPTQGKMSDWWKKTEKNAFYNAIKNYNVILIITGHTHNSKHFKSFRNICPEIRAAGAGDEFAEIKFNHLKPKELEITFVDAQGTRKKLEPIEGKELSLKSISPNTSSINQINLNPKIKELYKGKLKD
ncbi:metallophosphoesterase family protein [Candidatus Dependentiae bacterium]